MSRITTASELGISEKLFREAQALAAVPEAEFDAALEKVQAGNLEPSEVVKTLLGAMGRRQKTKLVSLWDTLKAGPWTPDGGWDNPNTMHNCSILVNAGLASKSLPLAAVALDLLAERAPDTVRGVMYAVVSAGWLPDTSKQSYGCIQRILNVLRKKRVIPFDWIVDNIRSTEKPSSWSGLGDFADTVVDAYRKDFWAELPEYVCIIVEKDTVAGRIVQVTREYDVPLHPLRGFCSTTFAYAIGEQWRRIEKPIHVYYIGDHDPSGREIERSVRERLAEFSERDFSWTRLAVEPEHFERYKIIPLAPKKRDTRCLFSVLCARLPIIPLAWMPATKAWMLPPVQAAPHATAASPNPKLRARPWSSASPSSKSSLPSRLAPPSDRQPRFPRGRPRPIPGRPDASPARITAPRRSAPSRR